MLYVQAHHPRKPLTESQWRALVRLWQAGAQGIEQNELQYGPGGFSWSLTLRRLAVYSPEPLIEFFKPEPTPYLGAFRITEAGRIFYEECWEGYHARYPLVEAPEPHREGWS